MSPRGSASDKGASTTIKSVTDEATSSPVVAPNSAPREMDPNEDTYVYRDFATTLPPTVGGAAAGLVHPQSLQAQKLPAKLASMLADSYLASVIAWQPHGRSWRVLNRDTFAEIALPRHFGHNNYASFVRIVNAWGFRRITRGADRDSYYHELFLRARPDLHMRMKRLAKCHRKTPTSKGDKNPDFSVLAKVSPLPETGVGGSIVPRIQPKPVGGNGAHTVQAIPGHLPTKVHPLRDGIPGHDVSSLGSIRAPMGNITEQMLFLLANNSQSTNPIMVSRQSMVNDSQASLPKIVQLQRDNQELRRRIIDLEKTQAGGGGGGGGLNQMIPDHLATLSSNLGMGGGGSMLNREMERMSRDFMMHSNNPMNNSINRSQSSLGSGSGSGGAANESSFMTNFPRQEMLLRAMQLKNQMGFRHPSSSTAAAPQQGQLSSTLERFSAAGDGNEEHMKAMMEWVAAKQQQ